MSETYQVRNNYNNRYHNFSNNECNIPFKDLTELKKKILYLENPKNKLQFFKFKDCKDWDQHRKNDELKTIRDGLMVYTNPKLCNIARYQKPIKLREMIFGSGKYITIG